MQNVVEYIKQKKNSR